MTQRYEYLWKKLRKMIENLRDRRKKRNFAGELVNMVRQINISADTSYEVLMANTSQHAYNANGERVHQLPYSDSDPFEHANNLSEPVGTVDIDGIPHSELEYTCSPIILTDLDVQSELSSLNLQSYPL